MRSCRKIGQPFQKCSALFGHGSNIWKKWTWPAASQSMLHCMGILMDYDVTIHGIRIRTIGCYAK